MRLPGGILREGVLQRDVRFRPVTGALDLELAELSAVDRPLPTQVTAILQVALESLAGEPPSAERVRELCVGDRQWLMRRLGVHLGLAASWLTARCPDCDEPFDVFVDPDALPARSPSAGFPFAEIETSLGARRFRVPNGGDQEALEDLGAASEDEAYVALARRCAVEPLDGHGLSAEDLEAIDEALEAASPEVAQEIGATCPSCGSTSSVSVDPYAFLSTTTAAVLSAVHTLASAYGWSEAEILALPRVRRDLYMEMVSAGGDAS
ncbi:MAG: hypothetical protein GY715_04065 [Planctomycetes bacterium]|nr:hypothetical protein [Planctomycetota bacterium]